MKKLDFICAKLVQNRDNAIQIETKSFDTSDSLNEIVDKSDNGRNLSEKVLKIKSDVQTSEICESGCGTPCTTDSCLTAVRNKRKNFVPKVANFMNERKSDCRNIKYSEFDSLTKDTEFSFLSIEEEYELDGDRDQKGEDPASKSASKNLPTLRTTSQRSCAKTLIDNYIIRFFGSECGAKACNNSPPREHFHCKLCDFRVFSKKEDMLRHFKWHKKREESMANGFMRFSATDDCSEQYEDCIHNLRQTHYHCMNKGCCKVYISTSDVQIHSNSHKKAASIAKEGFQRFKNCEDCGYEDCPYRDPAGRTTHFHCLRSGCSHYFKNKADMDKHKTHHQRDDLFCKDGFKKFMKCETCSFTGCAFSRVVNHIHCLKPGCDYILHSTSQMLAHKRKHEKQEKRWATSVISAAAQGSPSASSSSKSCRGRSSCKTIDDHEQYCSVFDGHSKRNSSALSCSTAEDTASEENFDVVEDYSEDDNGFGGVSGQIGTEKINSTLPDNSNLDIESANVIDLKTLNQPIKFINGIDDDIDFKCDKDFETCKNFQSPNQIGMNKSRNDEIWKKYITRYTANDPCKVRCPLMYKDHYHCTADENCETFFKSKDGVRDHAKQHELLDFASKFFLETHENSSCNYEPCPYSPKLTHYHCLMKNCSEIITSKESVFRRLEHYKLHEYSNNLGLNTSFQHSNSTSSLNFSSSETGFNSKKTRLDLKCDDQSSVSQVNITASNVSHGQTNFFVGELRRKRGRPPKYANNKERLQKMPMPGSSCENTSIESSNTSRTKPIISLKSQRGRPRTVSSPRHPENSDSLVSTPSNFFRIDDHHHPSSSFGKPLQTDGFTTYLAGDQCPDQLCKFASRLHFHCNQLRCYYSTDQQNVLEMHSQDFHLTFEIPDGFAAYDKMYDCRGGSGCPFNGRSRHFHCLQLSCNFEPLLKFRDLSSHTNLKHWASSSPSSSPSSSVSLPQQEAHNINFMKTTSVFNSESPLDKKTPSGEVHNTSSNNICLAEGFAMLSHMAPFFTEFGMHSLMPKHVPYTVERQCGRPFCKLKRRDHFHCSQCHQGFSHYDRLVSHMLKHGVTLSQTQTSPMLNPPSIVQSHPFQVPNDLLYNIRHTFPPIIADIPPSRAANQVKYQTLKGAPTRSPSANNVAVGFSQASDNANILITSDRRYEAGKKDIPPKKRKLMDETEQKIRNGQLLVENYDVTIKSISPDLVLH